VGRRRSLEEFELNDIPSDDEWIMENVKGGDNESVDLMMHPIQLEMMNTWLKVKLKAVEKRIMFLAFHL